MSRIQPSLLYLTIYNPTLTPSEKVSKDDEDAEEQAQILFYTSQEHAASRDKMLRQVGLAKALVKFSEIFHSTDSCYNVHSQSKRMVMLNPEPDYWIHAAVELARTPRSLASKPKEKDKGKGKAKEQESTPHLPYDYHDHSLHDYALRAHLLRGYEQFKLTHGSFTSIFNSLGHEALELQLERFFTVWAWSWDLSKSPDLNNDLGLPLHPLYPSILPLLDTFSTQLPAGLDALFLSPPHVVPSTRYRQTNYPSALSRHLLSLVPLHAPGQNARDHPGSTCQTLMPAEVGSTANIASKEVSGFLGMPSSLATMDVRKWIWPGALTFGKGAEQTTPVPEEGGAKRNLSVVESSSAVTNVDMDALEDAISSTDVHDLVKEKTNDGLSSMNRGTREDHHKGDALRPCQVPSALVVNDKASSSSIAPDGSDERYRCGQLDFACTFVFLADIDDPLKTHRRQVMHLRCETFAVALIADVENAEDHDTQVISEAAFKLFKDIEKVVDGEGKRDSETVPLARDILQPKEDYLFSFGHFTATSVNFFAKSDHLYNGKQILEEEPLIREVFSRGQHPQHWHVSKRDTEERQVFVEVTRKETSLSDVDDIIRKLGLDSELLS